MCLAIPAQIVQPVDVETGLATAEISGVRRAVSTALCPEAEVGDWVLIHVGFALSKVDEEEAHATLELLRGMGQDFEDAIEELKGSVIG
jgi:hydrogenase expression/formation protein HypC